MKKCALVMAMVALAILWGGQACVQEQKEMTFSGTNYWPLTPKVFPLDKDHVVAQSEIMGVRVNDSGDGPFHESGNAHCGCCRTRVKVANTE